VPEAVHTLEGTGVGGEKVGPIGEYGEEKALGDAVAQKWPDASTGRGWSFDEGEGGLG